MKTFPEDVHRLRGKHVLVTGGAGFIGSNLTEVLLQIGASVTVLDNFATGLRSNIDRLSKYSNFTFVEGDITQIESYRELLASVEVISHQAALGSVPRSIAFPYNTHLVNATGFLTILHEAKEAGVKRFVYASSSSVYGDAKTSPKVEGTEGKALSPYAVTKQLNEEYAGVYNRLHGMETIGLRYFNVFGPYQNPDGVYAAAIPKFLDKIVNGGEIVVNGDGEQTRDFTYVKNAVLANLLALSSTEPASFGKVYNVGCGRNLSLNEVIQALTAGVRSSGRALKNTLVHGPERAGDIRDSLAATGAIENDLGYFPIYSFEEGIAEYLEHALK
jgi:nucleoside-diphosphate-sugar epimerase